MKQALITGATGQDAYYLARLLLGKGYRVAGMVRNDGPRTAELRFDLPELELVYGDLTDFGSLVQALDRVGPDEVYNLGADAFVGRSFRTPLATFDVTATGALRMLEAVWTVCPTARCYQASSSEQFGKVRESPQTELTPFHPRSPYGVAKVAAHHATVNYREAHGLHASCGILFNHESPRRGPEYVTRKITLALARGAAGLQDRLILGNVDAARDWGYAGDYVEAMWLMLQQDDPDDYVIATGQTHTVREFIDLAVEAVGGPVMEIRVGDASQKRPAEVDMLCGDATKARKVLGWEPKVQFPGLVRMMVEADCNAHVSAVAA